MQPRRAPRSPRAGLFGPARRIPIEIGDGWDGAWTLADLDGDKTPDLVHLGTLPGATSVGPGRQVFLKRGLGDGAFGRTELWSTPNSVPPLQALDELVALPVTSTTREDILIGHGQGSSFSLLRFR